MQDSMNDTMRRFTPSATPNRLVPRDRRRSDRPHGFWSRWSIWAFAAMTPFAVLAAPPVQQAGFEADYEASGFVAPAGMPSPALYFGGQGAAVQQVGFFGNAPIGSRVGVCDGTCDGNCGMQGCGPYPGDGMYGDPGYGDCGGCGMQGCGSCGGLTHWRHLCLFCRGSGCELCQSIGRGHLLGCLASLLPYGEAGICAQRWYDFSADVMFLGHNQRSTSQVLTTQGVQGTPVLFADDADDDDLTAGMRFSTAFIFGPGGNIEMTYLGNNEWGDTATVSSGNPDLFSFISGFGAPPQNGFDDTDRSLSQSINTFSTFHSAEINYRRRTVGQFCRFQGSWLAGLRYLRFDSDFGYSTVGETDNTGAPPIPRFFNYRNEIDNKLFGPQSGFDVWWNVVPGVNVGFGAKGAWMDNNIDRRTRFAGNSLGPLATEGSAEVNDGLNRGTFMSEFELTLLYRLSHSWTVKTQYYLLNVDDIGFGFDLSGPSNLGATPPSLTSDSIRTQSLTIQGISLGAEYIW